MTSRRQQRADNDAAVLIEMSVARAALRLSCWLESSLPESRLLRDAHTHLEAALA